MIKPGTLCYVLATRGSEDKGVVGKVITAYPFGGTAINKCEQCARKERYQDGESLRLAYCRCTITPISDPDSTQITERDIYKLSPKRVALEAMGEMRQFIDERKRKPERAA